MLHAFITLLIGTVLYPLGIHREGMLLTAVFYIGREHAQAEYRSIAAYYGNHRASAPLLCGFDIRVWNTKSMLDWLGPLLLALLNLGLTIG